MMLRSCFTQSAMLAVVLVFGAATLHADIVFVNPANSVLSGAAGSVLPFLVDLSNTAGVTEFLNGINPSGLAGFDPNPFDVTPFFSDPSVPFFLEPLGQPGASAAGVHLFDVDIPANAVAGLYSGSFTLQGGEDGITFDDLASGSFTVQVTGDLAQTPEPGSGLLLITLWE